MGCLRVVLSLGLIGAMGGCDLTGDSGGRPDGLEALHAARAQARAAPYLTVVDGGGRSVQFAPGLTVIWRDGAVLVWERRDVSYTLRKDRRCYERNTEFERADDLELRRDAVVAEALIEDAELTGSEDHRAIRWRGPIAEEGYRIEGRVYLDRAGRPVRTRERTAWISDRAPEPWLERRYLYPSSLDVEHAPGPRCPSRPESPGP
jgi:hypothetical protein